MSALDRALNKAKVIEFTNQDKFVIFSDLHRGTNDWGDDFAHNQLIFFHALTSYFDNNFTYIEAGDGDELGENWFFAPIRKSHSHIFWRLREFNKKGRLHLLYGNHDMVRRFPWVVKRTLSKFYNTRTKEDDPLLADIQVHTALLLKHKESGKGIFIVHGHQADFFNNYLWWLGTLFLPLWKGIFQKVFGFKDPTSPAQTRWKRDVITNRLKKWVKKTGQITIAGHTHRSEFPEDLALPYFNTGSGVHPRCVTGIEIVNGQIELVKWWLDTQEIKGQLSRDILLARESMMRDKKDNFLPPIKIEELGKLKKA